MRCRITLAVLAAAAGAPLLAAGLCAVNAAPIAKADIAITAAGPVVRIGDDGYYDDRRDRRRDGRRGVVVDTPYAHVDAGDPVVVDAPYAHVRVGRGRVRVIAPGVNLSIPR